MWSVNLKSMMTLWGIALLIFLICLPLYLRKIRKNYFYGFRIPKAFESDGNWYKINRFGAGAMMWWAIAVAVWGILAYFIPPRDAQLFTTIGLVSAFIPILITIIYARQLD